MCDCKMMQRAVSGFKFLGYNIYVTQRELMRLFEGYIKTDILKDLSQFQWKSAHAPKKELPEDFL